MKVSHLCNIRRSLTLCVIIATMFIFIRCSDNVSNEEPTEFINENGFRHRFDLQVEKFVTGLELPTSLDFAPDGSGRLFVNELQSGKIKIIENGTVLDQPFANIETMVEGGFPVDGENGLIGITFDPDFESNGYVYISFAVRENDRTIGRLARVTDTGNKGENVTILLDSLPSANGHQVQSLEFGPDGKLYVMVGDAFNEEAVQDANTFNGKFLRMNKDGSIPTDNPTEGSYVFATGFRNNFDMSFRPNGDLVTTENGPSEKDEMNVVLPGGNYGWPVELGQNSGSQFNQPIHVWQEIVAPSGMHFYSGPGLSDDLNNTLMLVLFGRTFSEGPDPVAKRIQVVRFSGSGLDTEPDFEDLVIYSAPDIGNPVDVTSGPDGNLYFTDIFRGIVYKISQRSD